MSWVNLGTYAAVSTALATTTVVKAFHDYPNFYSASIYLSQNYTASLIMGNFLLLSVFGFTHLLQRLIYGPLRLIESEVVQQKLWIAVTEIALAMGTFRDEFEASVLLMFSSLLSGKIWSWIAGLRLEHFEQQSFTQSTLANARFLGAIGILMLFAITMFRACLETVLEEARPGVVLMFTFEFALLGLTSVSILLRYLLDSREQKVLQMMKQAEMSYLQSRDLIRRQREAEEQNVPVESIPPREIDEDDLDVAWEQKAKWLFVIDAGTELLRTIVYSVFFGVMISFHGLPLHILRNMVMTIARLWKKIEGYIRFQRATRDMNTRYQDPTPGELENSNICIICRDEMQVWSQGPNHDDNHPRSERLRPKKLPCGHIIHMSCLRSWLERQTVCPTCRQSAIVHNPTDRNHANNQNPRFRQLRFGPLRFMVGNVNQDDVQNVINTMRREEDRRRPERPPSPQGAGANIQHRQPLQQAPLADPERRAAFLMDVSNLFFQSQGTQNRPGAPTARFPEGSPLLSSTGIGSQFQSSASSVNPFSLSNRSSRTRRRRREMLDAAIGNSGPLSIEDREETLAFLEQDVREALAQLETQKSQLQKLREMNTQARSLATEVDSLQGSTSGTSTVLPPSDSPENGGQPSIPIHHNSIPLEFKTVTPGIVVPAGWKVVPLQSTDYLVPGAHKSADDGSALCKSPADGKGKETVDKDGESVSQSKSSTEKAAGEGFTFGIDRFGSLRRANCSANGADYTPPTREEFESSTTPNSQNDADRKVDETDNKLQGVSPTTAENTESEIWIPENDQ